jgi:hypothetical protein
MVDKNYKDLSLRRQSRLLGLNRSSLYVKHKNSSTDNLLSNLIAEIYADYPIFVVKF